MQAFVDKSDTITAVLPALFNALIELDEGIAKTRKNGLNYEYHENEDVLTACRRAMMQNNLMLHTNGGAITEQGKRLFQEFVFTITHVISGEYVAFSWGGVIPAGLFNKDERWIEDDKASGKMKSYAVKNWLLAEFLIGTPDQDTETGNKAAQNYQQPQNPRRLAQEPPQPAKTQPTPRHDGANPVVPLDVHVDENGEVVLPDIADSDKRFDAIPSAYPDTAPIGTSQHKSLMATLTQMKINDTDRHDLISLFTDGRTQSSKDLTMADYELLMKLLKIWRMGLLAGEEKWHAANEAIAMKTSGDKVISIFRLSPSQAVLAHAKVKAWLETKAHVEVPAMYQTL